MIVSLQLLPCNQQIFLISLSSHTYSRYTKARSQFALHHLQCESLRATCLLCPPFFFFFFYAAVSHVLWADILATEITAIAPGACYIHSRGTAAVKTPAPSRLNVVPGCVITECVMGMQGHLGLQSQVLALQLTASSIIDRGKPIRTICSPQRSARAA